jgi:hypothetical protein
VPSPTWGQLLSAGILAWWVSVVTGSWFLFGFWNKNGNRFCAPASPPQLACGSVERTFCRPTQHLRAGLMSAVPSQGLDSIRSVRLCVLCDSVVGVWFRSVGFVPSVAKRSRLCASVSLWWICGFFQTKLPTAAIPTRPAGG